MIFGGQATVGGLPVGSNRYHTVVIHLNISHTELRAARESGPRGAEGCTEAVWAEHVSIFEPPGGDEHVLRYGLPE